MIPEILGIPVNLADVVIIVIILISGLLALYRGFLTEALGVAGWIGATIVTLTLFSSAQPFVRKFIPINLAADVITGIALFLLSLVIISLITHSLANIIRGKKASFFDRILGLFFGILRGIVLLAFLYLLIIQFAPPEEHPDWIKESKTVPIIKKSSELIMLLVPKPFLSTDKDEKLVLLKFNLTHI
tara:strand:- start:559 stop:1119 length:561 start_codon:yes stop_codon:yes gene_type:complete